MLASMPDPLKALVVVALSLALVAPVQAESIQTAGRQVTAAIVVAAAAIAVVVVIILVHHQRRHESIIGCVSTASSGLSITSQSDQRVYRLTGDSGGIKPGERLTVEGKRERSGDSWVLEVHRLKQDLGACRP